MKRHGDLLQKAAALIHQLNQSAKKQQASILINEALALSHTHSDQIERLCHTIANGVSSPFPRSQQQLTGAVISLKKALKKISLVELISRSPEAKPLPVDGLRTQIKPVDALDTLLSQPLLQQALPHLWQATRYMHEKDQRDVLAILNLKLQTHH